MTPQSLFEEPEFNPQLPNRGTLAWLALNTLLKRDLTDVPPRQTSIFNLTI